MMRTPGTLRDPRSASEPLSIIVTPGVLSTSRAFGASQFAGLEHLVRIAYDGANQQWSLP